MSPAEPSAIQSAALQTVWTAFERGGRWPTFARADRAIYKSTNMSLPDVLQDLQPWLVLYDQFSHPTSLVKLTLAGLSRCSGTSDLLTAVLVAVRGCVQRERDHEPQDDEPGSDVVTINADDLRAMLDNNGVAVSPKVLNNVFAMVTLEPIANGSSGPNPDAPNAWSFQVSDTIRRFRHVQKLEDLLAATDRRTPASPRPTADLSGPTSLPAPPRALSVPIAHEYFSDRADPPAGREVEQLTPQAWAGFVGIVERGVTGAAFAQDFPERCPDGRGVVGCDSRAFSLALQGDIPALRWPLSESDLPSTLVALDLVEFCLLHVSAPVKLDHHDYFGHHHLDFEKAPGQAQLRENINRVLARNRLAYELGENGHVRHIAPPVIDQRVAHALPPTRDAELDHLLERARVKYRDPDPAVRREALEQLWDAFERCKTILDPDKRSGAIALIAAVSGSSEETQLLDAEMRALTTIGNDFRIRHHEATKTAVGDNLVDLLFTRMYALLYRVHPALR